MAAGPHSESIIDMFARLGRDMQVPPPDIERVIEHNRKNLEAFEKSARAAASGTQAIMSKQRDVLRETMQDAMAMMQAVRPGADPHEVLTKQAELARKTFETAVRNTGDVADLMRGSGSEAIEVLRQRIREGLDEMRDGFSTRK